MNPFPSTKEFLVLKLLRDHPKNYAMELVSKSERQIKAGTIYVLLGSLLTKGMVACQIPERGQKGKPKPIYSLTKKGLRMLIEGSK